MRLIALFVPALLPAVELTISAADEPVRGGLVWRMQVEVAQTDVPLPVTMTLREGRRVLADATALSGDGTIAFAAIPAEPAAAEVTLSVAAAGTVVERALPTMAGLGQRAATVAQTVLADPAATPLARLRLTQAVALLTRPHPTASDCRRARRLIEQAANGAAPDEELAVTDGVDGSVHPLRLYPPTGPLQGTAVWLRSRTASGPEAWPPAPPEVLAAARAAGWWVVEPYPAGDATWTGAARRRLDAVLATAQAAGAPAQPLLVVADPAASPGAATWPATPVTRRILGTDPAATFAQPATASAAHTLPGGLAAYAQGRFVIVVGSGEHRAAAEGNARRATAFAQAWAAHAHSRAVVVADTAFVAAAWADATLICCGTPRSHAVLAPLAAGLPLTWDERAVHFTATDGSTQSLLRGQRRPVALIIPRPGQREVLLLDGDWTFPAGTAPLGGLDWTCVIGDLNGGWVLLR
jgi:hypothetical protein